MFGRVKFTVGVIRKFSCPADKQQVILWDSETPGLGLRATAGAKSYIFETRLHKKTLRMTIGSVADWPIDGAVGDRKTARFEARRLKNLCDQGIDPRQQNAERQAKADAARTEAARRNILVSEAWAAYISARRDKWSARHLDDHESLADVGGRKVKRGTGKTMPRPLAPLMTYRLAEVDSARIRGWLKKEAAKRPTQARLAFNLFRAFLNWCDTDDDHKSLYGGIASPDACNSRIAKDSLPKKSPKSDCLQKEQLKAWFAAVRAIDNPVIAAYLQVLLLTGARRESLALLRWEDVDFRWNSLTIRDKEQSKGGENRMRTIPLTPYVASILADLKRLNDTPPPRHRILHGKRIENDLTNWKPSPWAFSSTRSKSGRLEDPTRRHYRACEAAAIDDISLHGLRRSFASLSEWVEVPQGVVAQIMGHKPSATAEKHYKVRPLDLLRLWHTRIERWVIEQTDISFNYPSDTTPELQPRNERKLETDKQQQATA